MKEKINNNWYIVVILIISIIFSVVVIFLYIKGFLTSGMECIPHIITVSSIVLGVVTLVLTIMISIRDGKIYKYTQSKNPELLTQIYGYTISSLIASAISIVLSLFIILTKELISKYYIYKCICVCILSITFIYMVLSVSMSFIQSIQMLRLDDNEL